MYIYIIHMHMYVYIYFLEGFACVHSKLFQLCLSLCAPMDYSLPGSCVHGIFQARILESVAICSSRRSS